MKKIDLVRAIAEKCGVAQNDVNKVVDSLQDVILESVMQQQDEVVLPKIGKFVCNVKPAHEGFNPLKKEKIQVPETHSLKFKASYSTRVRVEEKPVKKAAPKKAKK